MQVTKHKYAMSLIAILGVLALSVSGAAGAAVAPEAVNAKEGGFSTVLPIGYSNGINTFKREVINMQYVAIGPRSGKFAANINVVRGKAPNVSLRKIIKLEVKMLKRVDPSIQSVSRPQASSVAGSPSIAESYIIPSKSVGNIYVRQIYTLHDGGIYVITNEALRPKYSASLVALGEVISHWQWQEIGSLLGGR
jgi:hypothetical protein